jgi:hypothetical protein
MILAIQRGINISIMTSTIIHKGVATDGRANCFICPPIVLMHSAGVNASYDLISFVMKEPYIGL